MSEASNDGSKGYLVRLRQGDTVIGFRWPFHTYLVEQFDPSDNTVVLRGADGSMETSSLERVLEFYTVQKEP